jgi:uncharacterized protein
MGRPRLPRKLCCNAKCSCFSPEGICGGELGIKLLADELEALNLYDVLGYDQTVGSQKMGVSQPTFARILRTAHRKTSKALISGEALHLNNCQCGKKDS